MNDYFEKQVQHRFSTLPSHQRYFVYNLVKQPEDCSSLTLTTDQQSTQVVHRLILVTTTTATEQIDEQLVSGLEVYEYTTCLGNDKTRRTIYISKIDTTGSPLARGVTRRLTQAYVAAQQQLGGECSIHVFARAQPQYLFPHSAKDTSKRVLTDRQLVAWWRTTLSGKDLYSTDNVKAFWIVPGVDEQDALYEIGQQRPLSGNNIAWRYGYPYAADALAKDVIPRFEDDGKARYLGTLLDSTEADDEQQKLTVDEFWTLFGYSEECGSGKVTGVFVIEISAPTTTAQPTPKKEEPLNDDEYTWIWNLLMAQDFHDEPSNLKSTKTWLGTWMDILSSRSFAVTTNKNNNNNSGSASTIDTAQPIQTLTVKRKAPSSSTPTTKTSASTTESSTATAAVAAVNVLVPKRRKKEI